MAITLKTMKVPIGMRRSYFGPIATEPDAAHPTYSSPISMGEAVKCEMSVTTAAASIYGDDVDLLDVEEFVSAQLDVETAVDDLDVSAALYGHTVTSDEEEANADDVSGLGGYAYIQHLIKKDKTHVYRGAFFYKCSVMPSAEKMNDATKNGSIDPKMSPVSFKVLPDNTGAWRARKEFTTEASAVAWIESKFGVSA